MLEPSDDPLSESLVGDAVAALREQADAGNGGFGGAPKFPPASALELLLTRGVTDIPELTLDRMAAGGIYDQVGGGFARYSVDAEWLVPHFEKMLYDNALLARAYLHGWQVLGHERYRRVCEQTLQWALREMRGPEGGFQSALDADSEGEEGRFYVWTPDEIREALADKGLEQHADDVLAFFGVTEGGNFEGRNILHLPGGARRDRRPCYEEARRALYSFRSRRVWPGRDDKRLTSWNALMIAALAEAGAALPCRDYLDAAVACAEFVWTRAARRARAAAAHLQGRRGEAQRLPRGPRLPRRGAADALRGDLRRALVRRRARDRRRDDRALRRPRARRLLHHRRTTTSS